MPIRWYHRHFSIFHSFHDEAQFMGIPQVLTCLNSAHFPDLSHPHITLTTFLYLSKIEALVSQGLAW